jgi:hypothetical protein
MNREDALSLIFSCLFGILWFDELWFLGEAIGERLAKFLKGERQ